MKKQTQIEQAKCDRFNAAHPVGTSVRVYKVEGEESTAFDAKTRTPAQILSGHTAVVWLEGVSGCYCLDHVIPKAA